MSENGETSDQKAWRFKYKRKGKEKLYTIGPFPRVTITNARKEATRLRGELDQHNDPAVDKKLARAAAQKAQAHTPSRNWRYGGSEKRNRNGQLSAIGSLIGPLKEMYCRNWESYPLPASPRCRSPKCLIPFRSEHWRPLTGYDSTSPVCSV
ncbi:MAG: DUF4102 domain-containing protein [Gammaproteobacteria bacterium]|nr:DUF4102 domain-containing protein [Gammaproteobacteria bacterium]